MENMEQEKQRTVEYCLYPFLPEIIPKTHAHRQMSYEEFYRLSRNITGRVRVHEWGAVLVLNRLFKIGADVYYRPIGAKFPLPKLGQLDVALVIEEIRIGGGPLGVSVGHLSNQELAERVTLGILEPTLV